MAEKKILIIDDDLDIQTTLKKRLEHHGFSCTCVSTVGAALQRLGEIDPNLVILDLGFRGANGTAFLQSAKSYLPPESKIPPILVLSAYNERDVVDYVLGMGAIGFIAKPFDAKVLVNTVHDYLE
jgi:Response regulator containing CheY-like receiver, AAA-type ATPase, and DNA-binding domains